jgi:hypothetical protein
MGFALLGFVVLVPAAAFAQSSELEALRSMVKNMEQQLQKALQRIEQLEKEKTGDTARVGQVEKSVKAVQSSPSILNPAIGMAIDATAEHRDKTGGDFNFRAAEIGISASVDPYARGYAFFTGSRTESK